MPNLQRCALQKERACFDIYHDPKMDTAAILELEKNLCSVDNPKELGYKAKISEENQRCAVGKKNVLMKWSATQPNETLL